MKPPLEKSNRMVVTPIEHGWAVSGEIDAHTAPRLANSFEEDWSRLDRSDVIVVDLSGVEFMDSIGLAVFIDTRRHAHDSERVLIIDQPSSAVRRLLEITHLDEAFGVEKLPARPGCDSHR